MFTGLIHSLGSIAVIEEREGDTRLTIAAPKLTAGLTLGASIAVNGACLTAAEIDAGRFVADVSRETLRLTTLGRLRKGSAVNLEPSLTLATPLGGHLVSGHVDGIATVAALTPEARSVRIEFEVPAELQRYLARKGSVAIDGTSLTVNAIENNRISVNIVPHTFEMTIMDSYEAGTAVNIEVDLLARYLERLMQESQ